MKRNQPTREERSDGARTVRKTRQLCRQVQRTLEMALGETGDELLACLLVQSVVPAPNAGQLLVTLQADLPFEEFDRGQIEQRLARDRGRLRCEVAAAITRKKAPRLLFCVIGPRRDD